MDFRIRWWRSRGWLMAVMALGCWCASGQEGATPPPTAIPEAGVPTAPAPAVAPDTPVPAAAVVEPVAVVKPPAEPASAESTAPNSGGEDLISMTVSDARIQDVLRSLAAMRPGVNLIMAPEVQGAVSFALKDVTWEVALQLVTESNGFGVTKESDNIYRIRKPEVPVKSDIMIELLGKTDVALVPVDDLLRMTASLSPGVPLSVEKAREELLKTPSRYLKMLQVQNKPAVDVVSELAKKAGLNFAFSTELGVAAGPTPTAPGQPPAAAPPPQALPPVSINLRYVSVVDALNLVAAQGGLACVQQSGVWVVKPLPPQQLQLEPLIMETFEVKYMPVDDEVIKLLKTLMTARGVVSSGKNKVIVARDTSEGIETVRKALEAMDKPTAQVMIEARFFQVTAADSKSLGIDWSALGKTGIGVNTSPLHLEHGENITTTNTTTSGTPGAQTTNSTESIIQDVATGVITGTKTTTTASTGATEAAGVVERIKEVTNARTAVLDVTQFGLTLHALLTDSNVKQLSNPKIVVSSDEQATIHIGPQTPIVKSTAESASGGGVVRTFELDPDYGGETIQEEQLLPSGQTKTNRTRSYTTRKGYLDTGTRLTVAPAVKTEDQIYVKVVPELTTIGDYVTYGSGDFQVSYPNLFTTRVSTDFTIRSGQTIAIGGLVSEQTTRSESGVPVLKDIPGLKRLFSWEQESKSQTETIIFLTVKILPAEKLTVASGVPVRAYLVQSELDQIAKEDALGAEYQPSSAREKLQKLEAEAKEKKWTPAQFKKKLKERFGAAEKPVEPALDAAAAATLEAVPAPATPAATNEPAAPATSANP